MGSEHRALLSAMALCNGSYFQPLLTNEELPQILQTERFCDGAARGLERHQALPGEEMCGRD